MAHIAASSRTEIGYPARATDVEGGRLGRTAQTLTNTAARAEELSTRHSGIKRRLTAARELVDHATEDSDFGAVAAASASVPILQRVLHQLEDERRPLLRDLDHLAQRLEEDRHRYAQLLEELRPEDAAPEQAASRSPRAAWSPVSRYDEAEDEDEASLLRELSVLAGPPGS